MRTPLRGPRHGRAAGPVRRACGRRDLGHVASTPAAPAGRAAAYAGPWPRVFKLTATSGPGAVELTQEGTCLLDAVPISRFSRCPGCFGPHLAIACSTVRTFTCPVNDTLASIIRRRVAFLLALFLRIPRVVGFAVGQLDVSRAADNRVRRARVFESTRGGCGGGGDSGGGSGGGCCKGHAHVNDTGANGWFRSTQAGGWGRSGIEDSLWG